MIGILFTHIIDDARSKPHYIYIYIYIHAHTHTHTHKLKAASFSNVFSKNDPPNCHITWRHILWLMVAVATVCILHWRFFYIHPLNYLHRKKSGTVRSGDHTGHGIPDTWKCSSSPFKRPHTAPIHCTWTEFEMAWCHHFLCVQRTKLRSKMCQLVLRHSVCIECRGAKSFKNIAATSKVLHAGCVTWVLITVRDHLRKFSRPDHLSPGICSPLVLYSVFSQRVGWWVNDELEGIRKETANA